MIKKKREDGITLSQLLKLGKTRDMGDNGATYEDNCVVVYDMKPEEREIFRYPTRMNIFMVCLCHEGEAVVKCDLQECHIQRNSFFFCKPGTILQTLEGKIDRLSCVIMNDVITKQLNISFQKLLPHYTEMEKISLLQLSDNEAERLRTMIGLLKDSIQADPNMLYYHECVISKITAIAYEFITAITRQLNILALGKQHYSRQQRYFQQFIELLGQYYREERYVSFYAEKLHITPKYLGTIVHDISGRSAPSWITHYVISEAQMLLNSTDMSIQEISLSLNFNNQSFFGKYFKIHTGLTPGEYRKKNM